MSVAFGLLADLIHGKDDIPQHQFPALRVKAVLKSLFHMGKIRRHSKLQHGKRQNIGWSVNSPVLAVHLLDFMVICHHNINLRRIRTAFVIQNGQNHIPDNLFLGEIQFFFCFVINCYGHLLRRSFPFVS